MSQDKVPESIRSSVESFGQVFAILIALAICEALMQFISGSACTPSDRLIRWKRLPALISFVVLVVPFSHGMARYFYETYVNALGPEPYSVFLIFDTVIFSFEAIMLFVLSRSLSHLMWKKFYIAVLILLGADIFWGAITAWQHAPHLWWWVGVNIVTAVILCILLFAPRNWWQRLNLVCTDENRSEDSPLDRIVFFLMLLIILRTVGDYGLSWEFYFSLPSLRCLKLPPSTLPDRACFWPTRVNLAQRSNKSVNNMV